MTCDLSSARSGFVPVFLCFFAIGPPRAVGPILRRIFISKLGGFRASMCEYSEENHNQGSASQDFYWCCSGNSEVRALILQICEHKLCFGRQHLEKIWKYLKIGRIVNQSLNLLGKTSQSTSLQARSNRFPKQNMCFRLAI